MKSLKLRLKSAVLFCAAVVLLGGCAHPQLVDMGVTEAQVIAQIGQPSGREVMKDGTVRLMYNRQPMGQEVWWMFFDASGRYVRLEQALTYENFTKIIPGKTTQEEVDRMFGRCAETFDFKLMNQSAYMYRYVGDASRDMALWVQFDRRGIVTEWSVSDDPWKEAAVRFL